MYGRLVMTKPSNKEYKRLKIDYNCYLRNDGLSDNRLRRFLIDFMDLLNIYRAENFKYRERIKTLKEVIRMMKETG
jgi:hypothetical protein